MNKIKITGNGVNQKIEIDGKFFPGITTANLKLGVHSIPTLTLDVYIKEDMDIELKTGQISINNIKLAISKKKAQELKDSLEKLLKDDE